MHYAKVLDGGFTEEVDYYYLFKTENTSLGLSSPHPLLNQQNKFILAEDFYNSKAKDKKVYIETIPRVKSDRKYIFGNRLFYAKKDVVIGKIYKKTRVWNLTTSTHTFIANGVLVHNCYEIEKKHKTLPLDYAKRFIDFILTDPDPIECKETKDYWIIDQGLIIDFIGGDSFMHVDLMDQILQYYIYKVNTISLNHKWANNWRVSISSNGTLFERKECRDFILKWRDVLSLGISIDGCPTIHDKNRIFAERGPNGEEIGSMGTILKWWPWLREVNYNICNSTKATCSRDSIPYLAESLKFMHEDLGINYINQNFIMEDMGCTEADYEELKKQLDLCIQYVLKHRHNLYWSMIDERFLKRSGDNDVSLDEGWCGSGAMPALAVNGKIYPCFRWLPHTQEHEEQSEAYCVGDVWNGFNRKENFRKVREATRRTISPQKCLECDYEPCCTYCCTPDTPILMADLTEKPIKDVKVGDLIIGFDEYAPLEQLLPSMYPFCVSTVEKIFERDIDEDIYLDEKSCGFTGDHPFLSDKQDVSYFEKLETVVANGQHVFKIEVKNIEGPIFKHEINAKKGKVPFVKSHYKGKVHNLKTTTHTYIAGGFLCHNCLGGCYSEHGCFKRTIHICEVTKIIAQAAEIYWKEYDKLEGTDHFTKDIYSRLIRGNGIRPVDPVVEAK
jgi:uncharacterized protein